MQSNVGMLSCRQTEGSMIVWTSIGNSGYSMYLTNCREWIYLNWNDLESSIVNLSNIYNKVNADALFVSLIIEMDKLGMDLSSSFKISLIPRIIPRGTANVNNYATYGFSIMSMMSGQKQRDYFLFENSVLRDEFTSVANNNYNRDNYYWLKNHPDELVRINPKYFREERLFSDNRV